MVTRRWDGLVIDHGYSSGLSTCLVWTLAWEHVGDQVLHGLDCS